jgi:hypothetical protein
MLLRFGVTVPLEEVAGFDTVSCATGIASTITREVSLSALPRIGLGKIGGRGLVTSNMGDIWVSEVCGTDGRLWGIEEGVAKGSESREDESVL